MSDIKELDAKEPRKLRFDRMKLEAQVLNRWVAAVDDGATEKEILAPGYWSHVSKDLRPFDRIIVIADDWMMELHVVNVGVNGAEVVVLHKYEKLSSKISLSATVLGELKAKYINPVLRYGIVDADGRRVKEGFQTLGEAETEARNMQGLRAA